MRTFVRCSRLLRFVGFGLLGLFTGCGGNDVEQLHLIGQKTASKLRDAAGGSKGRLVGSYHSLCGALSEGSLESRIATRLAWDRTLAETHIDVQLVGPGVVRLSGQVRETFQRQRAYDVAHSTLGVHQVMNEIGVGQ